MAKVIAVVGATGSQGGSVARALLKESKYKVRAITRNPMSEKAAALKKLGAEVVKADLDDMTSIVAALDGCYGLFSTTFHNVVQFDVNIEIRQGKTLADAAKAAGIKHFIFSGARQVDDPKARSCAIYHGKLEVEDYINEIGIPMTCVMFATYMENYTNYRYHTKLKDGTRLFNIPLGDKASDIISLADAGSAVSAVFDKPSEFIGKRIRLVGDRHSIPVGAEILSRHLSPMVFKASNITPEEFSKLEYSEASEIATMFEYLQTEASKFGFEDGTKLTRQLNPESKTFEQWVIANKDNLRDAF